MRSISLNLLPRTFLDAMLLTRRFKLKCLWIDSLCKLQDSTSDWEIELAKMGHIYRGSSITIAATSAKDSRDGCFVEKKNWIDPITFEIPDIDRLPMTAFVRSASHNIHDFSQNRLLEDESLSHRG